MYLQHVDRRTTVQEIAEAYDISKAHLSKVIQHLTSEGYLRTHAGRNGGVSLARNGASITVRDVVEALEGRGDMLECMSNPSVCMLGAGCRLMRLFGDAEEAFYRTLAGKTIADLCEADAAGLRLLTS